MTDIDEYKIVKIPERGAIDHYGIEKNGELVPNGPEYAGWIVVAHELGLTDVQGWFLRDFGHLIVGKDVAEMILG